MRERHPAGALRAVLQRYATWSSSSSSVERGFSKTAAIKSGRSEDNHVEKEEDILILQCDPLTTKDEQDLFVRASKLWRGHFGKTRTTVQERSHKGLIQGPKAQGRNGSEAEFLRKLGDINDSLACLRRRPQGRKLRGEGRTVGKQPEPKGRMPGAVDPNWQSDGMSLRYVSLCCVQEFFFWWVGW